MLPFHPFPLFKWYHSRLRSWQGRIPQFCVCFQISISLTPHSWCTPFPVHTQLLLDYLSFALEKVLSTPDSDSAAGPDDISSHVLNTCSAGLAHPLSALFTLSFVLDHLRSAWNPPTSLHYITRRALGRAHTSPTQCLIHENISGLIHFWDIVLYIVLGPISQWWIIT